uniref:Potassium channel domain-containing protein n=1 Tax=Panagrolaimus sp. ES5 TaxID=591445 RepID=A0AC34FMY1_9BILA
MFHLYRKLKWAYQKFKVSYSLPFIVLVSYTLLGAVVFRKIELIGDVERREMYKNSTEYAFDQVMKRLKNVKCEKSGLKVDPELQEKYAKEALFWFIDYLNLTQIIEDRTAATPWTWMGSALYAGQLYTTIGYGYPLVNTNLGKVVSILYILVGIPVFLIILKDIGKLLSRALRKIYKRWRTAKNKIPDNAAVRRMSEPVKAIYSLTGGGGNEKSSSPKSSENHSLAASPTKTISTSKDLEMQFDKDVEENEQEQQEQEIKNKNSSGHFPIPLALTLLVVWILLSSALFCVWETDWGYLTSVYFFFVSISTVGLGDIVPSKPDMMLINFVLILVGLALLSMCVTLIQDAIERIIEQLLQEYIEEIEKMAAIVTSDNEFVEESATPFEVGMSDVEENEQQQQEQEQEIKNKNSSGHFPIPLALTLLVVWILLSSALFCVWETDWGYLTSVYFFFVSISTVGLGDIVPSKPDMMLINFVLILVGLALLSMCVTLIQDAIERIIEQLLQEYIEEIEKMAAIVTSDNEFVEESATPFEVGMSADLLTAPLTAFSKEQESWITSFPQKAKDWMAEKLVDKFLIKQLDTRSDSDDESDDENEEDELETIKVSDGRESTIERTSQKVTPESVVGSTKSSIATASTAFDQDSLYSAAYHDVIFGYSTESVPRLIEKERKQLEQEEKLEKLKQRRASKESIPPMIIIPKDMVVIAPPLAELDETAPIKIKVNRSSDSPEPPILKMPNCYALDPHQSDLIDRRRRASTPFLGSPTNSSNLDPFTRMPMMRCPSCLHLSTAPSATPEHKPHPQYMHSTSECNSPDENAKVFKRVQSLCGLLPSDFTPVQSPEHPFHQHNHQQQQNPRRTISPSPSRCEDSGYDNTTMTDSLMTDSILIGSSLMPTIFIKPHIDINNDEDDERI